MKKIFDFFKSLNNYSFLKGCSSIFNFWGEFNYERDDNEAIAKDWRVVGQDMQRAIDVEWFKKETNRRKFLEISLLVFFGLLLSIFLFFILLQ